MRPVTALIGICFVVVGLVAMLLLLINKLFKPTGIKIQLKNMMISVEILLRMESGHCKVS